MGKKDAVTIALMRTDDLDRVLAIEQASFSTPWSKNLFLSEFRNRPISNLLVALLQGQPERIVVGYCIFWLVHDEMHILNIAVDPTFRRRGIAHALARTALLFAIKKGSVRAMLEVRESNMQARLMYAGLGFIATYVRKKYYAEPDEDAIVMTLEFNP